MTDRAMARIADLLSLQSGVVSRAQMLDRGLSDNDIRRLTRRNELARAHDAVFVDHTGRLQWIQRAWAAVLACAPAALWLDSARRAADGPGRTQHDDGRAIHVAIARERRVVAPHGVVVHRTAHLDRAVLWNASPPRQRIEYAAIGLAARADRDVDAVGNLAEVLRARQSTAKRLAAALADHERIPRRGFLASVIEDIAAGTCSTLEHGYLVRVERPHGLPRAHRQFRESVKGPLYRDAVYLEQDAIVELDGRLFHSSVPARDADLERDLDAFATDRATARLGWGQVFDRPCTTAAKVGAGLVERGWSGPVLHCPRCPEPADQVICG